MVDGVEWLPHLAIPGHEPTTRGNAHHPMRELTRRAAGLAPGGWDDHARAMVTEVFDELASEWHTRDTPERRAVVGDAFGRGLTSLDGRSGSEAPRPPRTLGVEVGSGTGTYSGFTAATAEVAVSFDLSMEMLRTAPAGPSRRVAADASALPLRDRSVDLLVIINMFLFPAEVDRVLREGGTLVWVNVSGPDTPIHLGTDEVVSALPFEVRGVESTAGAGTWCALVRVRNSAHRA